MKTHDMITRDESLGVCIKELRTRVFYCPHNLACPIEFY